MISSRRGFTLIELLVVITIIGIFTGMLMPALHTAREAGRRTACSNNLLRLGLATGAYESAHGFYPAGVTDSKGPILNQASGLHHAWTERLLPYLDERRRLREDRFRRERLRHEKRGGPPLATHRVSLPVRRNRRRGAA